MEALAFSPDGASVVTAEWDGTVKRYDAATGTLRQAIPLEEPLTTVAFHPAGHSHFSEARAERDREGDAHEQQGVLAPTSRFNAAALVEASTGRVLGSWTRHRNVVSSAAVSPDGRAVVSGGWDKQLYLWREGGLEPVATRTVGWPVRRVRFSPEGRRLGVATWAPLKVIGGPERDPAGALFHVRYAAPTVMAR